MVKIVCDRCGREVYMKNPDLTGRAKIGFEEYDLCKYCILDIKRFINQGNADQHAQRIESVETMSCQECKRWIYDDRWGWFCPLKSQDECKYEPKDEPQTDCAWGKCK